MARQVGHERVQVRSVRGGHPVRVEHDDFGVFGADRGAITADPASPGPIHYGRGLPLDTVKRLDAFARGDRDWSF